MNNFMFDFEKHFEEMCKQHDEWIKKYQDLFGKISSTFSWFGLEDKQEESETANTQVEANDDFSDSDKQLAKARTKCKEAIKKMNTSQRKMREAIIKENFITKLSEERMNDIKNNCFDSSGKKEGLDGFNGINVSSFLNNADNAYNGEVTRVGEPCSRDEVDCFAFMDDDIHRMIDPEYKTFQEICEENDRKHEAEQQKKANEKLNTISITKKAVIKNAVTKVSRALRSMIRSEEWKNRYKDESKENKKLLITALLIKSIFYLFDSCNRQGTIFKEGDIVDQDLIRLTNDIILNDEVSKALYDTRAIIGQVKLVLTNKNHFTQHSYIEALDNLNIDKITKLSYIFLVGNNSFEVSFKSQYVKKVNDIEIAATGNSLPITINSNTSFEDLFHYILENSKFRANIIN